MAISPADFVHIHNHSQFSYEGLDIVLDDDGDELHWNIDFVDPECLLSAGYIEVKGWWDEKSTKKLSLLRRQHPAIAAKLTLISAAEMKELRQKYAAIVPN